MLFPALGRLRRRRHRRRHARVRAWTATSAPGSSSTSAPTARSCSATATGSSPPRRPPGRRSRAARSGAACAPPTARSRSSSSTPTARTSTLGVIGDVEPRGLCGSGLVDVVAELVRVGLLDATGRFVPDEVGQARSRPGWPTGSTRLDRGRSGSSCCTGRRPDADPADCVVLTQRDVRELQFAKAAISTGWTLLLEELGLEHARRAAGAAGRLVRQLPLRRVRRPHRPGPEAAGAAHRRGRQRRRRGREDGPAVACASAPAPRRCWRR